MYLLRFNHRLFLGGFRSLYILSERLRVVARTSMGVLRYGPRLSSQTALSYKTYAQVKGSRLRSLFLCGIIERMKLLILYRPNSEHARTVETFIRDFQSQHQTDAKMEVLSLDTREGAATASLYDVVNYPALLATTGEGMVVRMWQGSNLPLMGEVAGSLA
jgi:hypothetical protein